MTVIYQLALYSLFTKVAIDSLFAQLHNCFLPFAVAVPLEWLLLCFVQLKSLVILILLYFLLSNLSCSHTITIVMFDAQQNIHLKVCCMTGLNNICALLCGHFDILFLCSWSISSVNLIFQSADIQFCCVVLYARSSTVSSASADTSQRTYQVTHHLTSC